MCGIAGRVEWKHPVNGDSVAGMCERMKYRGPDDSGIVRLAHAVLGHRRLSIIDLSANARQPMASPDGRYHIVYNGELYNFREIREELDSLGAIFRSRSDTEVILNAYIRWGARCLDRFNGMFAFAVWDDRERALFLARDRFGKKPLYYYRGDGKIIFASELAALLCDGDVPRKVSYEALNCYLSLGYILNPLTVCEDVRTLEPATYLLIGGEGARVEKRRYWDYAGAFRAKAAGGEREIAYGLTQRLEAAVARRMVADVPVGAFLSGGIDSSSVARYMKAYCPGALHTFSIGFEGKSFDESADARAAAGWIGTSHHCRVCDGKDNGLLDEAIDAYDEPFADTSLIPTFALSRLASSRVKVALSGDGADEILAGYITYKADALYGWTRWLPGAAKKALARMPELVPGRTRVKLSLAYRQKQFFSGVQYPPEQAHYSWRLMFTPEERVGILGEKYRGLVYDTDPFLVFAKYYGQVRDLHWLDRHLYVDAMTWLADDILAKVDRASMRHGLEVRCPYLDVELAAYAASIPAGLKMKGLETKHILKKALAGVLPRFIIDKKKSGFSAPVGAWTGYEGVDEFKAFNRYVFKRKSPFLEQIPAPFTASADISHSS